MQGPLITVASLGVELGLQQQGYGGLVAPWHVGSSRTRIEPVFPALAGGLLITGPPGKSCKASFYSFLKSLHASKICTPS